MRTFEDTMGRIMVEEPAGGTGGGMTSVATRPATDDEIMAFHADRVAKAKAEIEAAEEAHKNAQKAHDEHRALQEPVIGAPPPPGPLDPQSVVAQGVGNPGADNSDGRLGKPLGGHTDQQGQPDQPVERGMKPVEAPHANMPSAAPPVPSITSPSTQTNPPNPAPTTPTSEPMKPRGPVSHPGA